MDRIDALRLLLDVAEAGSFSSAARQRAIATSTVALAVSQLEQEVGARLMTRSTRRLVFTHEGEVLLGDARRIVSEWDAALSSLREDGPLSGPIRITATNDFGRNRLRPRSLPSQWTSPASLAFTSGRCCSLASSGPPA